jgi:hypothetical protein
MALAVVALAWPMLFTTSGLGGDWEHHLWFVWRQELAIRADHRPSMFLNTSYSAFYPQYAFYGGTIYALAGMLAVAFGDAPVGAYIVTYILGFAAGYAGWYWAARIVGLGRCLAQVPALLFVSSAYYLTLVYGRGDWPEFLALSALPIMVAAGLSILRSERLRTMPAAALAGSSVVFFGSHNLTILWATTIFGLTCVAVAVGVPAARRQLSVRGVIHVAAVVVPALLVNAWSLLPTVAYASHTRIGSQYVVAHELLHETMHLVAFDHLFTLSRAADVARFPDDALSLPTAPIVWVLASIAIVLWSVRRGTWVRLLLIFSAITTGIVVVMTHEQLLLALPTPYTILQYSYRLEGLVLIGVTATVMATLVLLRSSSRRLRLWTWTVVPVLIVSAVGAIQQVNAYPRTPFNRDIALSNEGEIFAEIYDDYAYVPLPFVSEVQLPRLAISPGEIHDNRASLSVRVRPGQLMATNIEGGPNLLHITGASIAGSDERSQLVLAIAPSQSGRPAGPRAPISTEHISISPADGLPVVLGRLLALVGVAILTVELVVLSLRGYFRAR